ncbi:TniQ family protein [Bacillus cereus]|uniref:TniQ family protein n=1 Tax=Bacillus cereus TaxID=1396 RepID=UPI000C28EB08|nr:TniQ family protein [Bacillus cereus]HDR8146026.1 TniQ family protein [Bacillus cereus]
MFPNLVRSRLYGLHPKRINTPFVESLSSYLIRLAEVHSVHLGDLLAYEVAPELGKQYLLNSIERGGNRFYDGARTINGTGKNARDMIASLDKLTGIKNLEALTLVRFKMIFPVRNLLRKSLAWCPKCLNELIEKDSLYYPLIWCFTAYNVCINHKIYLEEHCPTCNKSIPFLHRKSRIGVCPYCQSHLFQTLDNLHCTDFKKYYISQSVESFFKEASLGKEFSINTLYNNLLSILYGDFDGNLQRFANYINLPKTTVWTWLNKEVIPPLNKILNIAAILNIPATVLYTEDKKINIQSKGLARERMTKIEKKRGFILNNEEVLTYLREIEKRHFDIKPISDIAKELGCSTKFLYTNFPELCRKISERNHQIKTKEQLLYTAALQERVRELCLAYVSQNISPTRKVLEKELNLPFLFKNRQMKAYFYQVRFELEKN